METDLPKKICQFTSSVSLNDYSNICSEFNIHIFKINFVSITTKGYYESCSKRELIPFSTILNVVLATVGETTFKAI